MLGLDMSIKTCTHYVLVSECKGRLGYGGAAGKTPIDACAPCRCAHADSGASFEQEPAAGGEALAHFASRPADI